MGRAKYFFFDLKIFCQSRFLFLSLLYPALLVAALPAVARKTNFSESHFGLYTGAGTYFQWLPHDNLFDPVPGLFADTATVTDSAATYLFPIRAGFFKDSPTGGFLLYGIYMMNFASAWDVTGSIEGSGTTLFASYGAGAEAAFSVYRADYIRLNFAVNGEYILQKALISFTETVGTEHAINLSATSYLLGFGLNPEIWLGDMYVLSLFAGYQYGFKQAWNVDAAGSFAGNNFAAGALLNPSSGLGVISQFGGFYFAGALKLNF